MRRPLGVLLLAGVVAAVCTSTLCAEPRTKITMMYYPSEFTPEMEEAFEAANPDIEVEIIQTDLSRFRAMSAVGNPPDIMRCTEEWIPYIAMHDMAMDLTPYFQKSRLLRISDFMPVMDKYKFRGRYYGMIKDWSPVGVGYYNKEIFAAAKMPFPSAAEPMTFREMAVLARKLQKEQGEKILIRGMSYWTPSDQIQLALLTAGQKLYSDDGTRINLANNRKAREIARFWFDLAKERLIESPLSPAETLESSLFSGGRVAMLVYGYWYGGIAESDLTKGKIGVMASPVWDKRLPRISPCAFITGGFISSRTKHPEEAFRVFEWFFGGPPARERAEIGWGIPALKSLLGSVSMKTAFDRERQRNLETELKYLRYVDFSPYILPSVFDDTIIKYFTLALKGEIGFDQYLACAERDINREIERGRAEVGR